MRVIRTFHTIGQGAFYTEEFQEKDQRIFLTVYDCGSLTLQPMNYATNRSKLGRKITSDLGNVINGRAKVDLLFISHFDMDHINGCKMLDPKLVIIPYLTPLQLAYFKASNGTFDIRFYNNISNIFSNAKIIKVLPAGIDNIPEDRDEERLPPLSDLTFNEEDWPSGNWMSKVGAPSRYMNSGGVIKFPNGWEYVMYNPNMLHYITNFVNALDKSHTIDRAKIDKKDNGNYVIANLDELKKIYKSTGPQNNHSLQVYSGGDNRYYHYYSYPVVEGRLSEVVLNLYHQGYPIFYIEDLINERHWLSGCLYSGDIKVEDFWLNDYTNILGRNRVTNVGWVQIPHHGSKENDGAKLLNVSDPHIVHAIISAGSHNRYGHPSSQIIQKIQLGKHPFSIVTEDPSTIFMVILEY